MVGNPSDDCTQRARGRGRGLFFHWDNRTQLRTYVDAYHPRLVCLIIKMCDTASLTDIHTHIFHLPQNYVFHEVVSSALHTVRKFISHRRYLQMGRLFASASVCLLEPEPAWSQNML